MAKQINPLIQKLINELTLDGERALHYAYEQRGFKNKLFNLYDSYGSAVYYGGRLLKETVRYLSATEQSKEAKMYWLGASKSNTKDWRGNTILKGDDIEMRGRDEIMDFFTEYKPSNLGVSSGLQLVVVAAMYYATYLEKGVGKAQRKYKVISGAIPFLQTLNKKYNGSELFVLPQNMRDINVPHSIKKKGF